jgi:hypothetical protein
MDARGLAGKVVEGLTCHGVRYDRPIAEALLRPVDVFAPYVGSGLGKEEVVKSTDGMVKRVGKRKELSQDKKRRAKTEGVEAAVESGEGPSPRYVTRRVERERKRRKSAIGVT